MNARKSSLLSPALQGESLPIIGPAVPRRGNRFTRAIARGILKLINWRIVGEIPNAPKMLLIGAPHTSNWDYVLTILTMMALSSDLHYVAKQSIFNHPFGGIFRWLGGIGVDRSSTRGFVEQMVREFERRESFGLAIMVEGSRSKVADWRSGFYFIALKAQVPITLVAFDYGCKRMRLGLGMKPTGDYKADLPVYKSYFANIQGKHPSQM